jgi:hypothetical protein
MLYSLSLVCLSRGARIIVANAQSAWPILSWLPIWGLDLGGAQAARNEDLGATGAGKVTNCPFAVSPHFLTTP